MSGWGVRVDVIEELKFFGKFTKFYFFFGGGVWFVWQGVRVDVIEELKFLGKFKKQIGGRGSGLWGQGRCERRIEVFVKIGGGGGGRS